MVLQMLGNYMSQLLYMPLNLLGQVDFAGVYSSYGDDTEDINKQVSLTG